MQRSLFRLALPSSRLKASIWQRLRQTPQPVQASLSSLATKAEATRLAGAGWRLMLFKTWQQQPQHRHMLMAFWALLGWMTRASFSAFLRMARASSWSMTRPRPFLR